MYNTDRKPKKRKKQQHERRKHGSKLLKGSDKMQEPIKQKIRLAKNEKDLLEILRTSENPEEAYLIVYDALLQYLGISRK